MVFPFLHGHENITENRNHKHVLVDMKDLDKAKKILVETGKFRYSDIEQRNLVETGKFRYSDIEQRNLKETGEMKREFPDDFDPSKETCIQDTIDEIQSKELRCPICGIKQELYKGPKCNCYNKERNAISMRTFNSGATRDSDEMKLDYDGFLSPLVLRRYAEYLNKHRVQADGKLRDSDNWQKGIPLKVYMKSLWRHFMDIWTFHRGIWKTGTPGSSTREKREEAICAVIFNASGYLHELLKQSGEEQK